MKLPLQGATQRKRHSDESLSHAITSLSLAGGVPNSSITDDMCSGYRYPTLGYGILPKPQNFRLHVEDFCAALISLMTRSFFCFFWPRLNNKFPGGVRMTWSSPFAPADYTAISEPVFYSFVSCGLAGCMFS